MLISFNWLKQYVDLPDSLAPEELALKLTMSTVEVEGVNKLGADLENIVVGKILKIEKHPNADKLKICTVDDGQNKIQVVCGGSNVREGMLVAFAKVGAKLKWHGQGELVELKPAKIRGVDSFGMICASTEIGLGEMFPLKDEKEILDLSSVCHPELVSGSQKMLKQVQHDKLVGRPLAEVLGLDDVVFEIDNKSMTHRPDLWGHYGLAREVAALYGKRLSARGGSAFGGKDYKIKRLDSGKGIKLNVKVQDEKLCPRYMAVAIEGVKIGPSPVWMQKLLLSVGLRPINNIVDITNYLLLDLGQPMHAFDASRLNPKSEIRNPKIIVRRAKEGEKFTTLDGQEHKLTSEMLVIADEKRAIALAGVMGGENSEINDKTTTIIYESANFDATNIRKTALKLGLRTESSARFEKSLDPHNAELALRRAVELTLEFCPGASIASKVADEKNFHLNQGPIELPLEFLNKKIGMEIPQKEVMKILESLGFEAKEKKKGVLFVKVSSWRATKDISIPEDLVEEVARIYGYGRIEPKLPSFPIIPPEKNELRQLERKIKDVLSLEAGFTEVYNYSFISPELIKKLEMSEDDFIELANPVAKDRPFLKRQIYPNLLENAEINLHNFDNVRLFEIGRAFRKEGAGQRVKENSDELLPEQDLSLGMVIAGKGISVPFYEASSVLEALFKCLNLDYEFRASEKSKAEKIAHPGRSALVYVKGEGIGAIGELHPITQEKLGIAERVGVAEINLNLLFKALKDKKIYHSLPQYPIVQRDIAFVVDKTVQHADIVKVIKKIDPLIEKVELFDVYEGKNIGEGKKSLAYHLVYQSNERTLTSEEVDKIHDKTAKKLEKEFGAEVRS